MKRLLLIIFVLFSILFVFSYSPNIIQSMVSRSTRQSAAMLLIGSKIEYAFENGDAYIGEDKSNPDWKWIIKNLGAETVTQISSTTDDTQHSGPIIGIKNNFMANNIDEAQKTGGGYCLPGDYICINFKDLVVEDYAAFTISKTTVDLSNWNPSWSNKDCILIESKDKDDGLKLQSGNLDINTISSDKTTDNLWIIFNETGSYAGIFYKDNVGDKQVAGFVNMNGAVDKNIADINNRRSGNVEIDLRGNFGTANNLDLVLDIQGFKGVVSNNGQDDITVNLMHSSNADFDGFGTTANLAENIDLVWQNTNIGKRDEDHRSLYGIIIKDPESNCDKDKVKLEIPWEGQEKADIEIVGKSVIKETTEEAGEEPKSVLDTEIENKENYNLILVGGPCINSLVEEFEEFPKCKDWTLKEGESITRVIEKNNKGIMLIAGTNEDDTKKAVSKYLDSPDLYPYTKNILIVVGEKASRVDVLSAKDIAASLTPETEVKYSGVTTTNSDEIPLGTTLGASGFFSTSLDQSDINTLQDTSVIFSGDDYNTHDEIMLYNEGPKIETSLSGAYNNYESDIYMELLSGRLRYYYVFDEKINLSDMSSSDTLEFKFLNDNLIITGVDSSTQFTARVSKGYYMNAGDEIIIESIRVKLVDVGAGGAVILEIDGDEQIFSGDISKNFGDLNIRTLATFY